MKLPCERCMKVLVDGPAVCARCDGKPTCGHGVELGAHCDHCHGVARAGTPEPARRDPDVELYEDDRDLRHWAAAQVPATCGNCGRTIMARTSGWTTCGACGTQTTVLA